MADADRYAADVRQSPHLSIATELASQPGAELVLDGDEPVELAADFLAISTPGHTAGHSCCSTGVDSCLPGIICGGIATTDGWVPRAIIAGIWPQQIASLWRLEQFGFEWILPGHGQRIQLPESAASRKR